MLLQCVLIDLNYRHVFSHLRRLPSALPQTTADQFDEANYKQDSENTTPTHSTSMCIPSIFTILYSLQFESFVYNLPGCRLLCPGPDLLRMRE